MVLSDFTSSLPPTHLDYPSTHRTDDSISCKSLQNISLPPQRFLSHLESSPTPLNTCTNFTIVYRWIQWYFCLFTLPCNNTFWFFYQSKITIVKKIHNFLTKIIFCQCGSISSSSHHWSSSPNHNQQLSMPSNICRWPLMPN